MFNPKVLSLDIGSKNTKIVLGSQSKKNVIIEKAITMLTPLGCYNDGNIIDITKFKSEILYVLQAEDIKCRNIIITSKGTTVITRDIVIPVAKKEDMDSIIKFQMERYLPIMFDDYIMQYKILNEFEEENVKQAKVTVVVYPKVMSEGYYNLVKELKGQAIALDISSNSINKLFIKDVKVNDESYSLEETVAVIDLGHDFINVNIISDGSVQFTRIINYGGAHIDVEISRELSISEEEAESKKIQCCNLGLDSKIDLQSSLINDVAKEHVRNWTQEIERMINYFKNKDKGNSVDKIYIYGGSSNLKGIESFIGESLNLPVAKIQSLSNVNLSKLSTFKTDVELSKYLNAIGAIIRLR